MHDLPGKLTVEELAELFSARTRLVEVLAEREDPLGAAREVIAELPEEDKAAALAAHPRIGEPSPEQRGESVANTALVWLAVGAALLVLAGVVAFLMSRFAH